MHSMDCDLPGSVDGWFWDASFDDGVELLAGSLLDHGAGFL